MLSYYALNKEAKPITHILHNKGSQHLC